MHLYAGDPYWGHTVETPLRFDKLATASQAQVLIAGGGFTGNLVAHVLCSAGMDVMVVERGRLGRGSSLANTGLLQYRSDKMLSEFIADIGAEPALRFYQMCLQAMDHLTVLSRQLSGPTDYRLRDSIYYASTPEDVGPLQREYRCLAQYHFPVEWLDGEKLRRLYGMDKPAALRTWHDADVNPYRFIQALACQNRQQGVRYYEDTELDLDHIQGHQVLTREGWPISFQHLILTTGYSRFYPSARNKIISYRTYAFCSEPSPGTLWKDEAMIWETQRPYLYLRTTADGRVIAGGLDEDPARIPSCVGYIQDRATAIARQVEGLFPRLDIRIAYAWDGLFCGTTDGLPIIGPDPEQPEICYLLGYEGNGMCYSMAGALILRDYLLGQPNPYQHLVRVDR